MSLTIVCDRCGAELQEPGALFFAPPEDGVCAKAHICVGCTESFVEAWREKSSVETLRAENAKLTKERDGFRRALDRSDYTLDLEDLVRTLLCERAAALEQAKLSRELLTELVANLPKCIGAWLSGSGGHATFSQDCGRPATWTDDGCGSATWRFCDEHAPERLKDTGREDRKSVV